MSSWLPGIWTSRYRPMADGVRDLSGQPLVLCGRCVLGGPVGVDAPEHAGGLTDLDEVAVRVAKIAPNLGLTVKWFGEELRPFGSGRGVERRNVGD